MKKGLYALLCIYVAVLCPLILSAQVTANFTTNIVSGCAPILVNFTDQSTGNPTSWNWDLGNGTVTNLQSPSTLYILPGTYTVTLTVSDGTTSDTKTITNYITVIPSPAPNFTASDSGAFCPPKAIQFTNLSVANSPGNATYFWDFGDGVTSSQANPLHIYNSAGNYTVTLNMTNSAGCSKIFSKPFFVQIYPRPVANFTAVNNNSCSYPVNVSFTSTSTGGSSYQWNFGDGGTSTSVNPSHNYVTPGSYTVSLIVTNGNGCKDTMIKPVFVNIGVLNPAFTKSASTACTGENISFTNISTPGVGVSTWHFGDGTTGSGTSTTHAYAAAGTYNATLVVNYGGCIDSTTQTVTINQGPIINFSASNTLGCTVPFTTTFTNTTTGATGYLWLFGDGSTSTQANPTHSYLSYGSYHVTLIAYGANGCNDTLVKYGYLATVPGQLNLTPVTNTGCVPATFTFSVTPNPSNTMSSYTWDFGDGNVVTNTSATVSHTYATPGNYNVTVTAVSTGGCGYTSNTATVQVGALPQVGFTVQSSACPSETVPFTNTSNSGNTSAYTYTWKFGDGSQSNDVNPNHIYYSQGTYTITLIANNNGCIDSVTQQIIIYPPMALFNVAYSCTNRLEVQYFNNSTGGAIFKWDFGDGDTSNLQFPAPHVYPAYGSYTTILYVINLPSGCLAINSVPILLFDLDAQFRADDTVVCKNDPVVFTADSSQYYSDYIWDFGDGTTLTTSSYTTTHAYASNGLFTVKLIVKDMRGCYDTLIKPNYIMVSGPTANFAGLPVSGCAPLTVNFTDSSVGGGVPLTSWKWYFGDGATSTSATSPVSHTYAKGIYTVSLKVTNANGCSDSFSRVNYINSIKPTASFTANPTTVCPHDTVYFTNNSQGSNLTYYWDFGDGTTGTAQNPAHAYALTGTYTVMLAVSDGQCVDTLVRTAYINVGGLNVSFTASDTFSSCPPLTVNFVNTSTSGYNFVWSFGNGNVSSLDTPSTFYGTNGVYTVMLAGQNGVCYDTMYKTITVIGPSGTFSYAPLTGCAPLTISLSSTNTNTQQLIWDMNNGVTLTTTASSTTYTYTQPGKYIPKLLLSDGNTCIIPIIGLDTVVVNSIKGNFSFSPASICSSGTIQFTDTTTFNSGGTVTRNWTFGDGGTSTAHNPSHNYTTPGNYSVRLILSSNLGCSDTITKVVHILPPPPIAATGGAGICIGDTASLQLQATGGISYSWAPSSGLSCSNCANPVAHPSSTTVYTVTGTDTNGCTATAQTTVTIHPLPTIQTGPNPSICAGANVQLAVSGATSYSWSPSGTLSCQNCNNPIASPTATTTYTVIGTSALGCSDSAQVTVNVNNLPNITATTSKPAMCIGDTATLTAAGATSYSWSPATGLSCANCAQPVANPTSTTVYTVTGVGAGGCSDTAMVSVTVHPLPVLTVPSQSICYGFSVQMQAAGAASYVWTPSGSLTCVGCSNPIASPLTTTTYTITGTSAAGCVNSTQATVTVNAPPVISVSNDQTICLGDAVSLQASGANSYSWSPATGLSCTICPNPSASPSATTTYTVIGADANGCKDTGQVKVTVNPLPVVDAGPDAMICRLNSTQLQATGALSYSWSPSASLSCSQCANPVATPSINTVYTVTGTDANGCVNTDNVSVGLHPDAQIVANGDTTLCEGQRLQLSVTGGVSYTWHPSSGLSCVTCSNPLVQPSNSTIYTVVGVDINGCLDSDQVNVHVILREPFTYSADATICEGQSVELFTGGGQDYSWSPPAGLNNPNISHPVATPTHTTTYTVIIKQGSCFVDTGKITVTVNPKPTVDAGPDQTIIAGASANLNATSTFTDYWEWSPGAFLNCTDCSSPVATPHQTTTFKVKASNRFGCEAEDEVTIFLACDNSQVFVPNTFTPNGDGNNDRFFPSGSGLNIINSLRVYSRWGEMLYQAQNISPNDDLKGWDGTYKGEELKPDVYVYIIEVTCFNGTHMQMKGDISLIR